MEANATAFSENEMPDEPPETPIQRALRLKNAAIAARPKPPRGGKFQREQAAAAHSSSKSKPWMSR
jgi:hypothetical protein